MGHDPTAAVRAWDVPEKRVFRTTAAPALIYQNRSGTGGAASLRTSPTRADPLGRYTFSPRHAGAQLHHPLGAVSEARWGCHGARSGEGAVFAGLARPLRVAVVSLLRSP